MPFWRRAPCGVCSHSARVPESVVKYAGEDPMGIRRVGVIMHPSAQDTIDAVDHVARFDERMARQSRHRVSDPRLRRLRNQQTGWAASTRGPGLDPANLIAQERYALTPVSDRGLVRAEC